MEIGNENAICNGINPVFSISTLSLISSHSKIYYRFYMHMWKKAGGRDGGGGRGEGVRGKAVACKVTKKAGEWRLETRLPVALYCFHFYPRSVDARKVRGSNLFGSSMRSLAPSSTSLSTTISSSLEVWSPGGAEGEVWSQGGKGRG